MCDGLKQIVQWTIEAVDLLNGMYSTRGRVKGMIYNHHSRIEGTRTIGTMALGYPVHLLYVCISVHMRCMYVYVSRGC